MCWEGLGTQAEMDPGPSVFSEASGAAGETDLSSDSGKPLLSLVPALETARLSRDSEAGAFSGQRGPCPVSSFVYLFLIHSAATATTKAVIMTIANL